MAADKSTEELLLEEKENGWARTTYRRPKALNCASLEMVRGTREAISIWASMDSVKAILMAGEGGRAFCSGGDVKQLRAALLEDAQNPRAAEQVFQEYNLIYENNQSAKPIVALMDGVTMGYGLGVASSARFRIATETTRLAMPENNIGLFPDVGFAYTAANKMPPGVGRLMAVTGCHLLGARDAIACGLSTHFVPKEKLDELEAALYACESEDAHAAIQACLATFAQEPPVEPSTLESNKGLVEAFAKAETLQGALAALEEAASSGGWAEDVLKGTRKGAPYTQALIWRLLRLAEDDATAGVPEPRRLALALERDFAAASRQLYRADFMEGVRVTLVDRGAEPTWQYPRLDAVPDDEVAADCALAPGARRLGILTE